MSLNPRRVATSRTAVTGSTQTTDGSAKRVTSIIRVVPATLFFLFMFYPRPSASIGG